jgi:hypothetical protein
MVSTYTINHSLLGGKDAINTMTIGRKRNKYEVASLKLGLNYLHSLT